LAGGAGTAYIKEVKGNSIHGFLNHEVAVEAHDGAFEDGKLWLWNKADAVRCFWQNRKALRIYATWILSSKQEKIRRLFPP
jgi:hypothetical protein